MRRWLRTLAGCLGLGLALARLPGTDWARLK